MKLINSREYHVKEIIEEGQCTLCGNKLNFQGAPFENKVVAVADCCGFVFLITPGKEKEHGIVNVMAHGKKPQREEDNQDEMEEDSGGGGLHY